MPPVVLLVEDNEADVLLFERAVAGSPRPFLLRAAPDGEAALRELERPPLPSLILLDLKLPRKSGLEVLQEMVARSELRDLPVVALTSSSEVEDVRAAFLLGVKAYVVKPVGFEPLRALVAAVADFLADPAGRRFDGHSLPRPLGI